VLANYPIGEIVDTCTALCAVQVTHAHGVASESAFDTLKQRGYPFRSQGLWYTF
jgi:hypothetical protein